MTESSAAVSPKTSKWPAVAVAVVGLVLSIVLEVLHYRTYSVPSATSFCAVGEQLDCTTVALSRYAVALGVPLPVWGIAGFMSLAIAAWLRSRWLLPLAALAALVSVVLLGIELFAIGAVCLLCEGVHLASVILSYLAWRSRREALLPLGDRDSLLLIGGPAAGIVLAVALFLPPYWRAFHWRSELPFAQGKTEDGFPWIGAENPEIVVHEFTDYSCPHCRVAASRTLRALAKHPDRVRLVRRQYPRMPCPVGATKSCQLVRVAYCAGEQGKFWHADRWLFEHATARHEVDVSTVARDLELDQKALEACIERDDIYKRADEESRLARRKRILGTPYYIVGDKLMSPEQAHRALGDL